MKKIKINQHVRLIEYPAGDINEYAVIKHIYSDGTIWLANLNMPYVGTISEVVSKKRFKEMTGIEI